MKPACVTFCFLAVCISNGLSQRDKLVLADSRGRDSPLSPSTSASLLRTTTTPKPNNQKQEQSHPIYDFARNVYLTAKELSRERGEHNFLISPFSVRNVAALLFLGSNGTTAEEIAKALQFPQDADKLVSGLSKHLQQTEAQPGQNFVYKVGNGIFVQKGLELNSKFKSVAESRLKSKVTNVDFTRTRDAAGQVNSWVSRVTEKKIQRIVEPEDFLSKPSLFIGNALYFNGLWEQPFDGIVPPSESVFYIDNKGNSVKTPMMQVENRFGYSYFPKLKATGISVPFKEHRFELILIKPDNDLMETENLLREFPLSSLVMEINSTPRNVVLRMPKFKLDATHHLKSVMQELGIQSIFVPNRADLSGILADGSRQAVSDIIHKATLEINEQGAVAAAASGVQIYPISSPSIFTVDKPFVFLINDRLTGPVFMGRMTNPLETSV